MNFMSTRNAHLNVKSVRRHPKNMCNVFVIGCGASEYSLTNRETRLKYEWKKTKKIKHFRWQGSVACYTLKLIQFKGEKWKIYSIWPKKPTNLGEIWLIETRTMHFNHYFIIRNSYLFLLVLLDFNNNLSKSTP